MGVGRSGTSTTCRVLNEHYGVCFGHAGVGELSKRGEVVWEDADAKRWLKETLGNARSIEWFHQKVLSQHKPHGCKRVGIKLLDLCLFTREQIASLEPELIVRTFRPRESYIRSFLAPGWRGPRSRAEFNFDRREAKLVEHEVNFPTVNVYFNPEQRQTEDSEILTAIDEMVPEWTAGS